MRKRSRPQLARGNVVQFRTHKPTTTRQKRRGRKRYWSTVMLVLSVATGGIAGWTAYGLVKQPTSSLAAAAAAPPISLCIADVHDGDTIRTCAGERIRISNIDAPELPDSPKCTDPRRKGWCDYELAKASRDALASFLANGNVSISRSSKDKYDRTLAELSVNGQDAGEHLIELGLAKPWI